MQFESLHAQLTQGILPKSNLYLLELLLHQIHIVKPLNDLICDGILHFFNMVNCRKIRLTKIMGRCASSPDLLETLTC
jgi:hypothetical protein